MVLLVDGLVEEGHRVEGTMHCVEDYVVDDEEEYCLIRKLCPVGEVILHWEGEDIGLH